jgi:hypothetical protein
MGAHDSAPAEYAAEVNDAGSLRAKETLAQWLGLNRATLAVLAVIGCLGLSEEIWSNFLSIHLKDQAAAATAAGAVLQAATYMGMIASVKNLLEGFGYIIGGSIEWVRAWRWQSPQCRWAWGSP